MAILSGNRAGRSPAPGRQIDSSIDLPGLAEMLLRRRWTIIVTVLAFVALAFAALLLISPRYTATTRIFIDPREQRVMQNEVVQQGVGDNMALVDSQIEVIRSESVLGHVIKRADLTSDPEFVPQAEGDGNPSEIALEHLAKATEVTRPDNTYVLEISVTTKEAAKSARLANAVAKAYIAEQASSYADATRDISSAIRNRLSQLQKQLQSSEEKVAAFKRTHNISQSEGQLLSDRRLTDLATRQSAAAAHVNETKNRLQVMESALRARGYVGAAATGTDSAMNTLRVRLAEAKRHLAELQHVLGPRNPRVIAAKGDVAQAGEAIRAESERLVASARDDYKSAEDTLNKINDDLKAAKKASFSTNEDLITLHELEREAQSNKAVYEAFLVRAKQTAQQGAISARTARVIADAAVPDSPSFPPRLPLLAAAVVLGLFVGVLIAILRDLTAGLPAAPSRALPLVSEAGADTALAGLVLVTTLDDPEKARQAALKMANGALSRGRSVIFVDLAEDAPASIPGLADIASGDVPVSDAVHTDRSTGLHTLYAGRRVAIANVSREVLHAVLEAISAEYDDVVVNVGELDTEHGLPIQVVTELARRVVLVVKGERADVQEKRVVEALSDGGAVAVSLVSIGTDTELDQVA
ncbi:MAG TPA: GumC family protein [Pararhizobium sp.]|nr:GumC family protein [Pararhizobium sp.]